MAWNGSGLEKTPHEAHAQKNNSYTLRRGLFVGLLVFVGALLAWLVISPSDRSTVKENEKKNLTIKEVKPAVTRKPMTDKTDLESANKIVGHPPTNQWGNPWHWGQNIKLRPANTSSIDRASLPLSYTLFETKADRDIAGLLEIEPGTPLLPCVEYGDDFVKSFIESLKTPVLVRHDDSDEAKAMKRAVNETKADLKARMDAGEDIAKIMNDTRSELVQLGAYREELQKMIADKERDHGATREDMEDIVAAANKMLEERGLKQIVLPEFYYQQIQMRYERRKAREE